MESPRTAPVIVGERPTELFELNIEQDAKWFADLSGGKQLDEESLAQVKDLIATGSIHLHGDNYQQDELYEQVTAARQEFLGEVLGWQDSRHPLHKTYNQITSAKGDRFMPLSRVLATQRVLHESKVKNSTFLARADVSIGFNIGPEAAQERIDNLTLLGINAQKVLQLFPRALGYKPETMRKKIENLEDLGLDYIKIIDTNPSAIGYAEIDIQEKVANVKDLGLNPAQVFSKDSRLLGFKPETICERTANLSALGLDYVHVVNKNPTVLGYKPELIKDKLHALQEMGLDAISIVHRYPILLARDMDKIARRVQKLIWLGHIFGKSEEESIGYVEHHPGITSSSDSKLSAHVRFVADHSSPYWEDADNNYLQRAVILPLHSHMNALIDCAESGAQYDNNIVERATRKYTTTETRREAVLSRLDTPKVRKFIGHKSLRAYFKNQPLSSKEQEQYPYLSDYSVAT